MENNETVVVVETPAATTETQTTVIPEVISAPEVVATPEAPKASKGKAAAEKKAEVAATEKLKDLGALADESVDAEWEPAAKEASVIFEQYADKNEVFVTIDAQGFWVEDAAASVNTKYRKFERK